MEAWVDVRMGCGEGTGEGLGIGAGVGMGVGNDKVGRGVGNGVGCEGGQDMGLSMTGRLPNPIFEGDFHPMPSGWAETKLSSRYGDEEHAVVPQPAAPFIIGTTKSSSKSADCESPHGTENIGRTTSTHAHRPLPFHEGCHSEARLPGRRHRETKQDEGYQRAPSVQG